MRQLSIICLLSLLCVGCSKKNETKVRKAIFIIVDGIAADNMERLQPPCIFDIAKAGHYGRAYCGGKVSTYSQTPTVSAIGYTSILTGTWMNKHNVRGNGNIEANYNYWTIFRIAKEQERPYKTAIFSSWTDNRTILLGEGRPETNNLKIDYVYDGYELDTLQFPKQKDDLHIFAIDSLVCHKAADCVRQDAPDLSWVYLWYTDDAYHLYGNSTYSDEYVLKEDALIGKIWDAVQYREQHFNEEWLVIVTTDHGRDIMGYSHGGQSDRERTIWMATNLKQVNKQFTPASLSHVDINPTICRFMGFKLPKDVSFEMDGTSFYGKRDIYDLNVYNYEDKAILSWQVDDSETMVDIYMTPTNLFKEGGKDTWQHVGTTRAGNKQFTVDLHDVPSTIYKFEVVAPNNQLTIWDIRDPNRPFAPKK